MSSLVGRFGLVALTYVSCGLLSSASAQQPGTTRYETFTRGTRWLERAGGGIAIKMLVEASNLGGSEVEVGEITFPAGYEGGAHRHGAIEIFYILSGRFEHTVNGQAHLLEPGMIGIVRPGDEVIHKVVSTVEVTALVIWAPGGEVGRIAPFFEQRPVPPRPR